MRLALGSSQPHYSFLGYWVSYKRRRTGNMADIGGKESSIRYVPAPEHKRDYAFTNISWIARACAPNFFFSHLRRQAGAEGALPRRGAQRRCCTFLATANPRFNLGQDSDRQHRAQADIRRSVDEPGDAAGLRLRCEPVDFGASRQSTGSPFKYNLT